MKVLFLTKHGYGGASSRYRTFQFLPFIKQSGIECKVSSLFDDDYLINRYKYGSGSVVDIVRAFFRRIIVLLSVRRYDLVVFEKELFPYFPALFERLLCWLGVRYMVDYDDALFHQYDHHSNFLIRLVLRNKIAVVMQHAELVIVGNQYLADYAKQAGAKRVEIIPTVIDLERYPTPISKIKNNDKFTIGWIGSPSTARYLQQIGPALAEICLDQKVKLRLIGSGSVELPGVDVEVLPWSEGSEVDMMHTFDVGIMPLPDEPWARGKCGFKLIQYMACGLPVVASPVGVNVDIIENGQNGFVALTQADWKQALETLAANAELRNKMGLSGRGKVEDEYCLQVTAPKLIKLLLSVASKA